MRGRVAVGQSARPPLSVVLYQMTQAELCRKKATECEEEAKLAYASYEAEAWLKLAKQWRALAERIERYS
jgi:hypothetical protein